MYWEGESWRESRSENLAWRRALVPPPIPPPTLVGGLASMDESPLLRERIERESRSEFMVANIDLGNETKGCNCP
jgi:hypothetical protein